MMHQELQKPEVQMLKDLILGTTNESFGTLARVTVDRFDLEMKELIRQNGEAKDNVKFLNTLERQFKNLQSNDFTIVEKTLPSLLKGLKVVFIISRHFKSDERISSLLVTISNELCNKIENVIDIRAIFGEIEKIPEESVLEEFKTKIVHGRNILSLWKMLFESTKEKLEEDGGDRWDFDQKPIKERPEHLIKVLDNFKDVIEGMKKFVVLLGPQLKAVTGNTEKIDELILKVKGLSRIFLQVHFNPFDKINYQKIKSLIVEYNTSTKEINEKTIKLIETTFADLRSSDSAFELLQKFINLQSLDHISEQLQKRYSNVLSTYIKELNLNKDIFERDRTLAVFGKFQPPVSGSIVWKRALMHRVKGPIVKFVKCAEKWTVEELKGGKDEYKLFAKSLDAFEKEKTDQWIKSSNEKAFKFLKQKILVPIGRFRFRVNYSPEFKLLIRETKHFDTLGFQLPKTILNIALQEKEYFQYADRLSKMIEEYHMIIEGLSPIERSLYSNQLEHLTVNLNPAINSFNLNTLGIYDFINGYREELKHFVEMKNKVDEKKRMIEDIIEYIEKTDLISPDLIERVLFPRRDTELMSLSALHTLFETQVESEIVKLEEKYRKIGETMLPQIEFVIYKKQTGSHPNMIVYYRYWERRIYNAFMKMILKALISYKMILSRPGERPSPIFRVSTDFNYMKVITNPHQNELRVTLNNLMKLIKDSIIVFPRWKSGSCNVFTLKDEGFESEEKVNYTYLRDVNDNTAVKLITVEISEIKKLAFSRLEKYKSIWEEDKGDYQDMYSNFKRIIWNPKNKFKIDKILEKNPSTANFEFFIEYFNGFLKDFESQTPEMHASFILVDFTNVKQAYIGQCKETLTRIGNFAVRIVEKRASEIQRDIEGFTQRINADCRTLEELKGYLNMLSQIRDLTMDYEFKIMDLEEMIRIVKKTGCVIGVEVLMRVGRLSSDWTGLLDQSSSIELSLKTKKEQFAEQTKEQVKELKEEIDRASSDYFERGPGSREVDLETGLIKMRRLREVLDGFTARKSELVLSEKLFNLEISSFGKLVEVEEDWKRLSELYGFYQELQDFFDKSSKTPWSKLDYSLLENAKKRFVQSLKKLASMNPNVLSKLKVVVEEFNKTLPLIEKIKSATAFKECHWEKLMQEIGYTSKDFNPKSILLKNVLDLKLQNFAEVVEEICNTAQQEGNNEEVIKSIESFWRGTNFEIVEYKKMGEKKGTLLKVGEEVNLMLNDHLVNLQNMEGSKYAMSLRGQIKQWITSLNQIQETVDCWISVQRKWMYLESIFIGNEDMRQQLPKEAKNFENLHKTFKKLNDQAAKNSNVLVNCVQIESTVLQLKNLMVDFDKSQKSLTDYLCSKKICFPRFYFISDDDLLSILGSSEISAVNPHLMKLFDNCKEFVMENGKMIKGMVSEEGESFEFEEPLKPEGAVEVWMNTVDLTMKNTLKALTKEGVYNFTKIEKRKWLLKYIGMVVLSGVKIWWTWRVEDAFCKVREGSKYALKEEAERQTTDLNDLIDMVRSDLEAGDPKGLVRRKVNTLIIIEVHQRDIVDRFVKDSILDVKEFGWESQLRFYWTNGLNDMEVRQCTGTFTCGYEYQGLNGRLVITPLTDRCVMTLTTALSFNLGGAPAGPAGTGKTETCKDLAKALARRCIVTNCGENFDSLAMGNNFSGLCQTGFWGCFDEFNRINPEVLSVVSAQIKNIQNSLNSCKKSVTLLNQDIRLVPTLGIFVTMNPGYEGRSELPDNLKALFRPVVMVVPDNNVICENMLMSEGFVNARTLAKKMTVLYKLSREQLSKQYHYDFGLRALKSVLVMAGSLKRASPNYSEEKVLMRALRDMNLPKFVDDDIGLFMGLVADLFPGVTIESQSRVEFRDKIVANFTSDALAVNDRQVQKVIQLFETMLTRHTTMIVGPTTAGKSTVIEYLQKSLAPATNVLVYPLNPKAQGLLELYGDMDMQTRDWTDGVLSRVFKVANDESEEDPSSKKRNEQKWILFDGDVDAVWVENMNSVMDDNKILTLSNGDRIRLRPNCKLLFEVSDLQFASPATISRCGMVFVDQCCLDINDFFFRWSQKFKGVRFENDESILDVANEVFKRYVPLLIEYVFEGVSPQKEIETPFKLILERTPINMVQQLTKLMDALLPENLQTLDANSYESLFIFCIMWSIGACVESEHKERLSKAVKDIASILLPNSSLFENFFDVKEKSFFTWESLLGGVALESDKVSVKSLIPTTDTIKYSFLLRAFESRNMPLILVGDPGTAKTVTLSSYLKSLNPETKNLLNINFSSRTSSMEVQRTLENLCDKRRPGLYCPKGNKKLVVFIDELHMPQKDRYNTQQPIALVRFLIEKGIMYERGGQLERRRFLDINFLCALLPPGGGFNKVDPRFLSLFNIIGISFPESSNVEKIYNTILNKTLESFSKECRELVSRITSATIYLYNTISEKLPRTPVKFHYIFNLRDLSRVYEGIGRCNLQYISKPVSVLRLWRNECERVFGDRLMTKADLSFVRNEVIRTAAFEFFPKDLAEETMRGATHFLDYIDVHPLDNNFDQVRLYREVEDFGSVRAKANELLEEYNAENIGKEMNLVIFAEAVEHLNKLMRILALPSGHSMLVGFGGSGKQSLAKLATFVSGHSLFCINLKRNYKESHFKEDLIELFSKRFIPRRPVVFLINDSQIVEEGFLELINTSLTVGVIPTLFDDGARNEIRNSFRDACKRESGKESSDEIWDFFCQTVRDNLHVVLCMSPAGESLRVRCRNFPSLTSSTAIDWFFSWPDEALYDVATIFLNDFDMEANLKENVKRHMVWVHSNINTHAEVFFKRTGRVVYTTPKNFLDFFTNFKKLFNEQHTRINQVIGKYQKGLVCLEDTRVKIESLKEEITEEKVKVESEKVEVEELLKEIAVKKAIASEKQAIAQEKQEALEVENIEIEKAKRETDQILEEKLPALEVARQKVSEIKKSELDYIRALPTPPKLIQVTVQCLQILKVNANANESDGWTGAKTMLNDQNLINQLMDYSKDESKIVKVTSKQIKSLDERLKIIKDELNEKQKTMMEVSPACAKLLFWVDAVKLLYDTNQIVRPLKDKVEFLTKEKSRKETELNETTSVLKVITDELSELKSKQEVKSRVLQELAEKVENMEAKVFKAIKLISDLEGEKIRWGEGRLLLKDQLQYLYSTVLLGASFLSYFGPFDQELRRIMTASFWKDLEEKGIKVDPKFSLVNLLSSEVEVSIWNSQGLPNDELSIQNGILTTQASRYPLCVDPQLQALTWIRKKEEKQIIVTSFNDEAGFARALEMSLKFKKILFIENVNTSIDPLIDPILEKNFVVKGTTKYFRLDNNEIPFPEKEFRLFMVTRLFNPLFSPEIFGKTSVVNFNVTFSGLQEQLLSEVVSLEQEEKEALRKRIITTMSEDNKILKDLEETLLSALVNSTGSILEDELLLNTLEKTKKNSISIKESLEKGNKTKEILEEVRQTYVNVAKRGAVLFFAMQKLSAISEMYQYSLSSYLEVFRRSIHDAKPANIPINRINNIIEKLTHNTYDYVVMSIFECNRLMFAFQMTLMMIEIEGGFQQTLYDFFIKGNTSFNEDFGKSPVSWLMDGSWKELCFLTSIKNFEELKGSFEQNTNEWKEWFNIENLEDIPPPSPFADLSKFNILLLLRIFRPDRVINGIKRFIIDHFKGNDYYVSSPTINFKKILGQTSEKYPIVFVLSPGADPINDIQSLANSEGMVGNKFKFLSLGQNMEKEAEELIANASQRGHWVMLQNCDLLPMWLKELEKILENQNKGGKVMKEFRLWLTTKPTKAFPLGILQNATKIVTEPPEGLRFNMRAIASKLTDENMNESSHPAFKSLIYVLCLFHAILLDRRKFGKIGFNVSYDFNESDFRISFKLLNMYLSKSLQNNDDEIPWESLKYLIGEAMYGGRVTDEFDRRTLTTYLDEYMGNFLFDDGKFWFASSSSYSYVLPSFINVESMIAKINDLPIIDSPVVFGLHPNSEITYYSNSAKLMWANLLSMHSVGATGGSTLENSELLQRLIDDILDKTPSEFDLGVLKGATMNTGKPVLIFLYQELERFNFLIEVIKKSMKDLKKAILGEIVLNNELEAVAKALLNGLLPDSWRKKSPQTFKKLASWLLQFKRRVSQYQTWSTDLSLKAVWISGLHFPEAFLTALVQNTCRLNGWALDKSSLFTTMTSYQSYEDVKEATENGCYIYGLFMEGASWDSKNNCIVHQAPKEIIKEMPVMQINPIEITKLKLKDILKVPVYVTQNRRNAGGVGHIFDADMPTKEHPSHWILEGIAMSINLDD